MKQSASSKIWRFSIKIILIESAFVYFYFTKISIESQQMMKTFVYLIQNLYLNDLKSGKIHKQKQAW